MKFGPVPVADAAGTILAHSIALPKGRLKKGQLLSVDDLDLLRAAGIGEITVARLVDYDVDENTAAARVARALIAPGSGLSMTPSTTGRVNVIAEGPGLLILDANALHALNAIDPMITLATLRPFQRVAEGDMVATVKIISYGVAEAHVAAAELQGAGTLALSPPRLKSATLIQTRIQGSEKLEAKAHNALETRLSRLDVSLTTGQITPHISIELAEALRTAEGDILFVLTASATSDMADVGPAALVEAGGEITHFGLPVDPGNLLFFGHLNGKPVIGLPGCARSPALNGADWILERIICGHTPTRAEIAEMGVGGLLKESPARPHPRRKP